MDNNWYYKLFGAEFGPVTFDEVVELAKSQTLSVDDEVRLGEKGVWRRVGSIGQLMTHLPYQAAKKPVSSSANSSTSNSESQEASWSNDTDFETSVDFEPPKVADSWWCQILGNEVGPMTFDEMADLAKNHTMSRDDQVRFGENGHWRRAGSIGPLMAHFPFQAAERVITTGQGQRRSGDQISVVNAETPAARVAPPAPAAYAPAPVAYAPAPVEYAPAPVEYAPAPVEYAPAPVAQAPAPSPAPPRAASAAPSPAKADERWWCLINDREYGPVDMQKITEWAASGRLHSYDYLRKGLSEYVVASDIPGLFPKRPEPAARPSLLANSGTAPRPAERPVTPKPPTDAAMSTMSETMPSVAPAAEPRPYTPSPSPSASMSTMNNSGGFGGGSSGYARATVPVRRPMPSQKSGGGDLSKLLLGPVGMGVGGVLVLGALVYFALPFIMVANATEIAKLKSLQTAFNEVVEAHKDGGSPTEVKAAADKMNKLAGTVVKELKGTKPPTKKVVAIAKSMQELAKMDVAKADEKVKDKEKGITSAIASAKKTLKIK